MPSEWQAVYLEEIAAPTDRPFAMGPFGSNIRSENYVAEGVPIIRGTNLSEVGGPPFISDGFVFLSNEKANELSSSTAIPGDIVFVAQGTVGKVGIVPRLGSFARYILSQNLMRVRIDTSKADPRFVYYFFQSPIGQQEILSRVNPTGVPCISRPLTSLRTFRVQLPPQPAQRHIGEILGNLDEKIELNRKMSDTLEAMARALFKSWFVDFDPVRSKAEGRDTGLPAHIAELFPDSFEDSEIGEIPHGWAISAVGDLATVVGGSTPSTKEPSFWEGGHHYWATPKDLSSLTTPVLLSTERQITDVGLAEIGSGLLPPGTVLLSSRAPIGYLAVTEVPVAVNQGFIAMQPKNGVSNLFLLLWAGSAHDTILGRANGSTFLEISKANFRPIRLVVPPPQIMQAFEQIARPLHRRIVVNERESRSLVTTRDALLPKLISGEIRVSGGRA